MKRHQGFVELAAAAGVAILALGLAVGRWWGHADRAKEVIALQAEIAELTGECELGRRIANDNATDLRILRSTLASERDRNQQQQQAAKAELAARDQRIARLERDAAARKNLLQTKAATDDDCAPLRDQPVCAAVAERLWGADAAAARPH